jgi:hypothetical protein
VEYTTIKVLHLVTEVLFLLDAPVTISFMKGVPVSVKVFLISGLFLKVKGRESLTELLIKLTSKSYHNEEKCCYHK